MGLVWVLCFSSPFAKRAPLVKLLNPNTKTNRNCMTSHTVFTSKQIYVRRLHEQRGILFI